MTVDEQEMVERGQARLVQMPTVAERAHVPIATLGEIARAEEKPPKKRRSDAGKPRPKPVAEPNLAPGMLTQEQANALMRLTLKRDDTRMNLQSAQDAFDDADAEYVRFIRENTARNPFVSPRGIEKFIAKTEEE